MKGQVSSLRSYCVQFGRGSVGVCNVVCVLNKVV